MKLALSEDGTLIEKIRSLSQCTAYDILAEYKTMCPEEYPYVAFQLSKDLAPPSPLIMGGWCGQTRNGHLSEMIPGHLMMCPGWPETSCCDFEPSLLTTTNYHHRNTSISRWMVPAVCLNCN